MNMLSAVASNDIESNVATLNEKVSRLTEITDGIFQRLIDFGWNLIVAIVIFLIGRIVLGIIRNIFKKIFTKSNIDTGVVRFVDSIVKVFGYIIILIVICGQIGIQTTSFITLLGTAGLSIGLALQGSFSNFAGGVLILISKPFVVGDYIILEGVEGKVEKIDIIYTTLLTPDNRTIKIPNGTTANCILINTTNQEKRRVDVEVGIHYEDNIDKAKKIGKSVVEQCPFALAGEGHDMVVKKLDSSSIVLEARMWVEPKHFWEGKFYLNEELRKAFSEHGITIPYNQLDVTVHQEIK